MKNIVRFLRNLLAAIALVAILLAVVWYFVPETRPTFVDKLLTNVNISNGNKGTKEVNQDFAGKSNFGRDISNQFAHAGVSSHFYGLNGAFNSVNEAQKAINTENSEAWWTAYEIMLIRNQQTLEADKASEEKLEDKTSFLAIHVNACMRNDEEIRRHLEKLDNLPVGSYDSLPIIRWKSHWVTRVAKVSEAEYNSANETFQGWHPEANGNKVYRHKYAVNRLGEFFVLEIFEDKEAWASVVVKSYDNPSLLLGLRQGGIRHDDLSIILEKDPCLGKRDGGQPQVVTPKATPKLTPQPSPVPPTPTPTLKPKDNKRENNVIPESEQGAPAPVGTANPEPTNAPNANNQTSTGTINSQSATSNNAGQSSTAQTVVNDPPVLNTYSDAVVASAPNLEQTQANGTVNPDDD